MYLLTTVFSESFYSDVSEYDPTDLFDTDNVVVCQFDKVCEMIVLKQCSQQ